jgi:hypothetical protein
LASGVLIDASLLGEAQARERILRSAACGLEVFRVGPLCVVRFREAVRMHCRAAVGAPLVAYGNVHSTAPLDDDERCSLDTATDALLRAEGGVASVLSLDTSCREDIAEWLDVSVFEVVVSVSLGEVVSSPQSRWAAVSDDVRPAFGVAPLTAEAAALAASLSPGGASRRTSRMAAFALAILASLLSLAGRKSESGMG